MYLSQGQPSWHSLHISFIFLCISHACPSVVTDAGRLLLQHQPPYDILDYRYSPGVALLGVADAVLGPGATKVVFTLADLLGGWLLYAILRERSFSHSWCMVILATWVCNPFVAVISTRGSHDSVVTAAVLGAMLFALRRQALLAGAALGLAIHLKMYPVIFVLSFWFLFDRLGASATAPRLFNVSSAQAWFASGLTLGFGIPTALSLAAYGMVYWQQAVMYHLARVDYRHNFSLNAYLQYLGKGHPFWERLIAVTTLLPQLSLLPVLAHKFAEDLPFACLLQALVFVMFNKVCTSQVCLANATKLPLLPKTACLPAYGLINHSAYRKKGRKKKSVREKREKDKVQEVIYEEEKEEVDVKVEK